MIFTDFFDAVVGTRPYAYQHHIACDDANDGACVSKLIDVPTGCGKTAAVVMAWLWNRVVQGCPDWPRRLVFVLPMRVLVEQTEQAIQGWLERAGLAQDVKLHVLMGGTDAGEWHLGPERDAILLGTQDMVLSRFLGRGYGAFRARWPVDFGLLNQDCLFVYDEVQLFDVGLSTSAQLHAFRESERDRAARPCFSWWMSATLQDHWLDSVDFAPLLPELTSGRVVTVPAERTAPVWQARKPCRTETLPDADDKEAKQWARLAWDQHHATPADGPWGRVTLVIANTVKRAALLFAALENLRGKPKSGAPGPGPELRLVHSRFRGEERARWRGDFLNREACARGADRIIVATQVVEAGVDVSASALITELAPWPSLVQRFGRAARYGGTAQIVVVDRALAGEKSCLPYTQTALDAARAALAGLDDASLGGLLAHDERLRGDDPGLHAELYSFARTHLLTRVELDQLFDTTPDLTGADLDISRFIRAGDERDLSVFWRAVSEKAPDIKCQPERRELCPVPAGKDTRGWLCQENGRLHDGCRAWVWDYLDDAWRSCRGDDLYPGRTVLVDERWGGYHPTRGFTGDKKDRGTIALVREADEKIEAADRADAAQDRDDLSKEKHYKTIRTHSAEVAAEARALLDGLALEPGLAEVFDLAARLHDWGKAHHVFQDALPRTPALMERRDLAKSAIDAPSRYKPRGFRHELASTLAVLELLRRADPWHAALLGPHRELLAAASDVLPPPDEEVVPADGEFATRLRALDAGLVDLLLYLICTHHGKVRGAWHAAPADQEDIDADPEHPPLRGVHEGDTLDPVELPTANGAPAPTPQMTLHLDPAAMGLSVRYGASWGERVSGLLRVHGPFKLAYLEALFRCADVRASKLSTPDPLLPPAP